MIDKAIENAVGVFVGPSRLKQEWDKAQDRRMTGAAVVLGAFMAIALFGVFTMPV